MFATGRIIAPEGGACETCSLADCPFVPGYGPDKADIILLGEAPGYNEVRYGRPFVGKAGQLLDQVLEKAGINRDDCFITNACLCRPEDNRTPKADEIRACRPRLISEILSREPKVILALGNIALRALLGSCKTSIKISKMRGAPFWSEEFKAWVVPSYHPAAVLRNGNLYPDLIKDVQSVTGLFKSKVKVGDLNKVDFKLLTNYEDIYSLVNEISDVKEVAVDTEWSSKNELLCIGISWGPTVVITRSALADPRTKHILNDWFGRLKLIGQNFKSDLQRLWKYGITSARVGQDTMLMHYTTDERHGHDLGKLAREYLQWDNYKDEVAKYKSSMEDCPDDLMYPYNARDVAATWMLVPRLAAEMGPNEWNVLNTLLLPAANILADMEMRGIMIDRPYLEQLKTQLMQDIANIKNELYSLAGKEFNPNSPKQLVDLFYKHLKLPVTQNGFSTDKSTLELLSKYHPLPAKMLEYRKVYKFLSTYVSSLLDSADETDRVHTNFNLHGTTTGRLSSSDPLNLQNITRGSDARNMFKATPGYTLVECDMSQSEVRCLAWYSQDRNLIAALTSDVDIHTANASTMFGVKPEDVTKDMRQASKHLTFGVIYQMSAQSLADELKTSLTEAEDLIRRFFSTFKQAYEWIEATKETVLKYGKLTTVFGRTRRFPLITKENKADILREAVNFPIQSVSSDITLTGLLKAGYQLWGNQDTRLLLTVHDSIMLETKHDPLEVGKWLANLMTDKVLDGSVPFKADIKYGPKWGTTVEVKL